MAKSGMNPKTLQYIMGHSDISVTLNPYTHVQYNDAKAEPVSYTHLLRILRALRFLSARDLVPEERTEAAIRAQYKLLKSVSWERIRDEFLRPVSYTHLILSMLSDG